MRKKLMCLCVVFSLLIPSFVWAIDAGIYSEGLPAGSSGGGGGSAGSAGLYRLTLVPMIKFTLVDISNENVVKPLSSYFYSIDGTYYGVNGLTFRDLTGYSNNCNKNCNTFGANQVIGSIASDGKSYSASQYIVSSNVRVNGIWKSDPYDGYNLPSALKNYFIDDGENNNFKNLRYMLLNELNLEKNLGAGKINFDKLTKIQKNKLNNMAVIFEPVGSFCQYNPSGAYYYGYSARPCIYATFKGFNKLLATSEYYRNLSSLMITDYPQSRQTFAGLAYFGQKFGMINSNALPTLKTGDNDKLAYYNTYSKLDNGYGFGILYFSGFFDEPEEEPEPDPELCSNPDERKGTSVKTDGPSCPGGECKIDNCEGGFVATTIKTINLKVDATILRNDAKYKDYINECKNAGNDNCSVHFCDDFVDLKIQFKDKINLDFLYSYGNGVITNAGGHFNFGYRFQNESSWSLVKDSYHNRITYEITYKRLNSDGKLITDVYKKNISYGLDYKLIENKIYNNYIKNHSGFNTGTLKIDNIDEDNIPTLSSAITKKCSNSGKYEDGNKKTECIYSVKKAVFDSELKVVSYDEDNKIKKSVYYISRTYKKNKFRWKVASSSNSDYLIDSGNKCFIKIYNQFIPTGGGKSNFVFKVIAEDNLFPKLSAGNYPFEWQLYSDTRDKYFNRIKDSYNNLNYKGEFSVADVKKINLIDTSYKSYKDVSFPGGSVNLVDTYYNSTGSKHCKVGEFRWGCDVK